MKKISIILAVCLLAFAGRAQLSFIDVTTVTTNMTTSSAYISIPGVCTNYQYTVVNSNNIVVGDTIPAAFGKVNSDFTYISNSLAGLAFTAPVMAVSNAVNNVSNTVAAVGVVLTAATNALAGVTNALKAFPATGVLLANQVGVNTNAPGFTLDVSGDVNFSGNLWRNGAETYQTDSGGNGGTTLMLRASDNGTPMYLHVTSLGVVTATGSP